jgi:hypothetical protein
MAISATNLTGPSQTPATADVAHSNTTHATGGTSPFQALLATTAGQTVQATTATATTTATAAVNQTDDPLSLTDETTTTTDTTTTEPTGLLALAAQVLGLPANAAVAQATGQTNATSATNATTQANDSARSRIDQLRLERTGGFISAVFTNRFLSPAVGPSVANTGPEATTNATANTAEPNPALTNPANPALTNSAALAVPTLTQTAVVAQSAKAVAVQGGTASVPAQAPIVTNLIPPAPVPPDVSVTNPPVAAPEAPTAPAALPAAQLGDRPTMTGDRFAAIAEAGAQLATAPTGPPGSVIFANTLDQELTGTAAAAMTGVLTVPPAVTNDGGTVLPLVNPGTQATAAIVLPPLAMARTGELGSTDAHSTDTHSGDTTSVPPGVVNPQAPLPAFSNVVATQTATPASPAVQVADAVVSHAHVLEHNGATEFHMRLDPPDLGRVQIQLVTRGDEVHGQVLVASDAVRQMIESQLPELRQRLEAAGVNVQQFNVATDSSGGGNQNAYRTAAMLDEVAPRPATTGTSAPQARIGRVQTSSLDVTV